MSYWPAPRRLSRWIGAALLLVGASLSLMPTDLQARDSDESRLGAKQHALGTSHEGRLSPPEDAADWRYVKVEEPQTIIFSLRAKSETQSVALTLTLTRATGDELERVSTEEGTAEIERELEPGLYYVKVAAEKKVGYALTIERAS